MGHFRWKNSENKDAPLHVCLMVSRNKDNKHIEGFRERRVAKLIPYTSKGIYKIMNEFSDFCNKGFDNEFCRLYISLNARNPKKVRKCLIHTLIDEDDFNLANLDVIVASIAARKENALEHKWFFDFDSKDTKKLTEFIKDIKTIDETAFSYCRETPHGYAIIVNHGFDTRKLMEKWSNEATLKRDDLICYAWKDVDGVSLISDVGSILLDENVLSKNIERKAVND